MIRRSMIAAAALLVLVAMSMMWVGLQNAQPALAAETNTAAVTAAASGTCTINTFVGYSAAGVIVKAAANTTLVAGVCEQSSGTGAITRYAPAGSISSVLCGTALPAGLFVAPDSSGYAVAAVRGTGCYYAGITLTASTTSGQTVRVLVWPGMVGP